MKIETTDKKLSSELLETDLIRMNQTEKIIAEGVLIRYEGRAIREAIGFPELFNFSIYIAEHIGYLLLLVSYRATYTINLKIKKRLKSELLTLQ